MQLKPAGYQIRHHERAIPASTLATVGGHAGADEEGCIASTVRHLNLELKLQKVPHEIVVVDDGSSDKTWPILNELAAEVPELHPMQNRDRMVSGGPSSAASITSRATRRSS